MLTNRDSTAIDRALTLLACIVFALVFCIIALSIYLNIWILPVVVFGVVFGCLGLLYLASFLISLFIKD